MILADVDKTTAEKQIMNVIRKNTKKKEKITNINVLVKKGDPLIKSDLQDVSIAQAKAVLIMNKDDHEDIGMNLSKSDLNVIKVILSLGQVQLRSDITIVSEIKKIETKQKILTLSKIVPSLDGYEIIPICFDRRLGQIIVQTILQKEINIRFAFTPEIFQEFQIKRQYKQEETTEELIHIKSKAKKEELSFLSDEFIYAESEGNYVVFHLVKQEKTFEVIIRNSIREIEQQLAGIPYFMRTHRAFIVNLGKVISKNGNSLGYRLKLKGSNHIIPVSRQNTPIFDELTRQFLLSIHH